jgi:hypothetical protein
MSAAAITAIVLGVAILALVVLLAERGQPRPPVKAAPTSKPKPAAEAMEEETPAKPG